MKLLILSTSTGSGHLKTAEAVRLYAERHRSDIKVREVDYLKYLGPAVDKIISGGYVNIVKLLPMLYGKLYNGAKDTKLKKLVEILDTMSLSKMAELISEVKPDAVLCTHPFPLETLSILKARESLDLPLVATITDYTVHPKWIYGNVDAYIVPNDDFVLDLVQKGISVERVHPLGIPVGEGFSNISQYEKDSFINELGLDEGVPTVLIMSGGFGLINISETFRDVMSSSKNLQVIACAGKNEEMISSLEKIYSEMDTDNKAVIMGYTDKVNLLMSISDVIITKPGGLTVTEAMHMRLPIVIKFPIPGQEEENAEYLLNCGIAMSSDHMSTAKLLDQILLNDNSRRVEYIKQMEAEKSKTDSSRNICELLVKLAMKNR